MESEEKSEKNKIKAKQREICDIIKHILSTPKKDIQKLITFNEKYKNYINNSNYHSIKKDKI